MKHLKVICIYLLLASSAIVVSSSLFSDNIRFSSDITMQMRGVYYTDDDVVTVGEYAEGVLLDGQAVGLPHNVEIDALLVYSNQIVFSTDIDFENGATLYANEDLVVYDVNSGQLSMFSDGSTYGIKSAANLDAIAASGDVLETFYLSFDITITLPGVGVVADEDIIVFENGTFVSVIKGSDLSIPAAADIDALYFDNNILYFSLDITADINGSIGDGNDLWALDMGTSNVLLIGESGIDARADLVSLDYPRDSDGDWLTDLEEYSGIDEVSSTMPGTAAPLLPRGYVTSSILYDTDGDSVSDGLEAIYGTDPTDPLSFSEFSGAVIIIR